MSPSNAPFSYHKLERVLRRCVRVAALFDDIYRELPRPAKLLFWAVAYRLAGIAEPSILELPPVILRLLPS